MSQRAARDPSDGSWWTVRRPFWVVLLLRIDELRAAVAGARDDALDVDPPDVPDRAKPTGFVGFVGCQCDARVFDGTKVGDHADDRMVGGVDDHFLKGGDDAVGHEELPSAV